MARSSAEDARREREELDHLIEGSTKTFNARLYHLGAPARMLASLAIMLGLVGFVAAAKIPNPNMLLVAGLVVCSTLFEWPGGIVSAAIMVAYTLYFFSDGHSWTVFTDVNVQKVLVTAAGVGFVTFFTCALKHAENQLFRDLARLARLLKEDNELLEVASGIDSLTGLRNRFALRRDYRGHCGGGELCVAMIDLDDFKGINDRHGHRCGDYALARSGEALRETFGEHGTYRYGGDEFLVISDEGDPARFAERAEALQRGLSSVRFDGEEIPLRLSVGFVYGEPVRREDLRAMMHQADERLYEAKRAGKDRVASAPFVRDKAESPAGGYRKENPARSEG